MVGPYSYGDDYYYNYDSVDCTLSLGNPSTRRSSISDDQEQRRSDAADYGSWDFHHRSNNNHRSPRAAGAGNSGGSHRGASGGDNALLARRCANCDTTSTPLWRNGPRGPKSLCNACGIRYKKEQRRASAASAAATNVDSVTSGSGGMADSHTAAVGYYNGTPSSWSHQYFSPPAPAIGNQYGFMDDVDGRDTDSGIQYATWQVNFSAHGYQPC